MTIAPFDFNVAFAFTDDKLAELDRCVSLVLFSRKGTLPLAREIGINMDFLDKPPETAKSLYTAEVVKAIAMAIPSVRVREVIWTHGDGGKLIPKVVITSA